MTSWRPRTLLAQLSPRARDELLALGMARTFATGDILIREDGTSQEAFLLVGGFVKVTTRSVLLTIRSEGDMVGEMAAKSDQPRSATVTACTPVAARFILADKLAEFTDRHRKAEKLINALIADQLLRANRRRAEFATLHVKQRLARVILELAEICGSDTADGLLRLPSWLPQADLADLVGVNVDTVQRALRDLRTDGVIATRPITILNSAALAAVGS